MFGFNIGIGGGGAEEDGDPPIFDSNHAMNETAYLNYLYQTLSFCECKFFTDLYSI